MPHTEIAIAGAGIAGLATAYTLARAGRQVHVFERDARPVSASIRNFGMVWPIGQPPGPKLDLALRSREIWGDVARAAGFWHNPEGSLHLAYRPDAWAVLQEFAAMAEHEAYDCQLLSPAEVAALSPATRTAGLLGGLLSRTEMIVDPREVPGKLITYLQETWGVHFHFQEAVQQVGSGHFVAGGQAWTCDHLYLCTGADLESLFPEVLQASGIVKVKLQMMRTAPQPEDWRMGPALAGELTLTHYEAFEACPSLPALRARIAAETPWFPDWGIHVMMSQNGRGELVIGDSHVYGPTHDPFLDEQVNQYILDYLWEMAQAPAPAITERWYGVYPKLAGQPAFIHQPLPGVTIFTGLGGAGMTLSFGVAETLGVLA